MLLISPLNYEERISWFNPHLRLLDQFSIIWASFTDGYWQ